VAIYVAALAIDITALSHVFLYDFPEDPESYIHRTGRTGRAGASGEAISLVDPVESMRLRSVARHYSIEVETRPLPTDEDVQATVSERVTALLEAELRKRDRLVVERMERMLPLAQRLGEDDDERAIIAMLLDEFYQRTLHAPPDLPPIGAPSPSSSSSSSSSSRAASRPPRGGNRKKRKGSRRR